MPGTESRSAAITNGGVNNVLFDSNQMYGDAEVDGSNSTGIRIKSANDRGGLVQNIQYSNSCFANHGTQIQFNPVYNTNTGTLTPNFKNILLQKLRFSNQGAVATGSVQFTGANNNGTLNPLIVTLDNVTIDTLASSQSRCTHECEITLGPGQVSSTLTSLLLPFNGANGNTITDLAPRRALCRQPATSPSSRRTHGTHRRQSDVTAGQFPTAVVHSYADILEHQVSIPYRHCDGNRRSQPDLHCEALRYRRHGLHPNHEFSRRHSHLYGELLRQHQICGHSQLRQLHRNGEPRKPALQLDLTERSAGGYHLRHWLHGVCLGIRLGQPLGVHRFPGERSDLRNGAAGQWQRVLRLQSPYRKLLAQRRL